MEPRLTAGLRVAALLRRMDLTGRPAYVVRRGDDTAGALAVTVLRPGGKVELWVQDYDPLADSRAWLHETTGAPRDIDATLARRGARDPDLWVIELELPQDADPRDLLD
ncbi:DUF1491 family protein [Paracoccus luteus]|uniref:DUF1491 family protein n=1 Tax=Paracoccus luteus TaxID=2508543 RepID=UPI00106FBBBB|nr:DUF1491 family protein [Paracoccus luteus]